MARRADEFDWTPDAIATLRTLWAEGHTTAEIGRRMACSKNAVIGKAHRLGLPSRPSPISPKGEPNPRREAPKRKQLTREEIAARLAVRVAAQKEAALAIATRQTADQVAEVQASREAGAATLTPQRALPGKPCCWPIGEPRTPGFRFCGEPVAGRDGLSARYCQGHVLRARAKPETAEPKRTVLRGAMLVGFT